ncbi:S41 family peptidase [Candidatus Hydrogenosomobacter endosymbioticus]|uniref:Tricorn protease homolog n=1 Tax=Candidatus Hydrogenosomobacter endosymbioticus TaxID=2558174 RepID=A0ABM7V9N7_9PROT|nr:S41 family peptidase [Candidatus Hydrogenosomobacter endosymbioticus]BDB96509.1 tricorn protease [Candidatus Hydrogenosomobacter endosymbioticus]
MNLGYFQHPALGERELFFVCQDSVWKVSKGGGRAQMLTHPMRGVSFIAVSPNNQIVAFCSCGEVFIMSADGGVPIQLTRTFGSSKLIGFFGDRRLVIASYHKSAFSVPTMFFIDIESGRASQLNYGPCEFISFKGAVCDDGVDCNLPAVIQRGGYNFISWKRYKGGMAADLWIDRDGAGKFDKLIKEKNNLFRPMWIKDRVYFLSDIDGTGNIYSCDEKGSDIKMHTKHSDFYARQSSYRGGEIAYSCGGEVWLFDSTTGENRLLAIDVSMSGSEDAVEFADPARGVTSVGLSHSGAVMSVATRGRLFSMTPHKGPVQQIGDADGVRYRISVWIDKSIISVKDIGTEDVIEIFENGAQSENSKQFYGHQFDMDFGKIISIKPFPKGKKVVMENHKHEIIFLDLENVIGRIIDRSPCGKSAGIDVSPDGMWIAYSKVLKQSRRSEINVYDIGRDEVKTLVPALFFNFSPAFDRSSSRMYFLSARPFGDVEFKSASFDEEDLFGVRPMVALLKKGDVSPFLSPLMGLDGDKERDAEKGDNSEGAIDDKRDESAEKNSRKGDAIEIDFFGVSDRIETFPVPARDYESIVSIDGGRVLYSTSNSSVLKDLGCGDGSGSAGELFVYDFASLKEEEVLSDVSFFGLSGDLKWTIYKNGSDRFRIVPTGSKPDDSDTSFRDGGKVDIGRIKLRVCPSKERRFMFDEAWRLQKLLFWREDMGGVDWDSVRSKYCSCVDKVGCTSELFSVIEDMHGELGTSHAYVLGQKNENSEIGSLGADIEYDEAIDAYRVHKIYATDSWIPEKASPLRRSGVDVKEGDVIWSIYGRRLSKNVSPEFVLERNARNPVDMVISEGDGSNKRNVVVFPSACDDYLRYRDWVENNRKYVGEKTCGKVGYIHIPDMSGFGYGEFLRAYIAEYDKDGLIIDVRFNGGGNASSKIFNYLNRKRIGADKSRLEGIMHYQHEAPKGAMVCLANGYTGSDGDLFSYGFKRFGLGPLIGTRTWGGVVGICPRYDLLNGVFTSQPEYSFWVDGLEWGIENHGVEPDIEIEISPNDYRDGTDPQLDRGIEEVLGLIPKYKNYEHILKS